MLAEACRNRNIFLVYLMEIENNKAQKRKKRRTKKNYSDFPCNNYFKS